MGLIPFQFKTPPKYVLACILCSASGTLFGMDTGIIGPVTDMKDFKVSFGSQNSTIHGLIVSCILIPAALSSFFAGYVADRLGRPKGISIGVFIFGVGAAIEAGAVALSMFIVGRIVEGLGEGLFLGNLVVLICEISPTSTRGALTTGPQLATTVGLVMGYFISYGTSGLHSSLSWRMPFILLAAFSMILCGLSLLYLPESPQWLGLHGRYEMAEAAWDKLGVGRAEREKVVLQVRAQELDSGEQVKDGTMDKLLAIFSKDVLGRTILAVFLMGMQQMSGIDGVLYYAPQLFQKAGLASSEASFLASGVSALVIFAVTIPGLIYADKWGRRASIIYGGVVMGVLMFLMGGLYAGNAVHQTTGPGRWVVIVCIYLFSALYSVTWGISVKVYAAEIQPQRTRASATTLAHSSNWVCNFLVALTTPVLLAKSSFGAYFLFGGCCVITVAVGIIFMHETQGRTFGEIDEAFKRKSPGSRNHFRRGMSEA
ncbi:Major facilitator superfamily domain general substrate transporter [Penicillium coprophilum]|uniref:Major facilitator superfamily domain general substrate transporter n=1 Tax=Penicillium coprophilum TaxID=36646 RepID=UPI00239A59E5|nr:Major facilitator superfamily domain general substrate transporter [Penicillium coprophilum]KAJ5158910.1 Major facilitator superfamily domain general substrate transporter [Penicillium coprophilum]